MGVSSKRFIFLRGFSPDWRKINTASAGLFKLIGRVPQMPHFPADMGK
jgi:hypothetical protein